MLYFARGVMFCTWIATNRQLHYISLSPQVCQGAIVLSLFRGIFYVHSSHVSDGYLLWPFSLGSATILTCDPDSVLGNIVTRFWVLDLATLVMVNCSRGKRAEVSRLKCSRCSVVMSKHEDFGLKGMPKANSLAPHFKVPEERRGGNIVYKAAESRNPALLNNLQGLAL